MMRRHYEELTARLERVADTGQATITKTELQRWYDIQRVGSKTRRNIVDTWQQIVGNEDRQLVCIDKSDIFLLLDGGAIRPLLKDDD